MNVSLITIMLLILTLALLPRKSISTSSFQLSSNSIESIPTVSESDLEMVSDYLETVISPSSPCPTECGKQSSMDPKKGQLHTYLMMSCGCLWMLLRSGILPKRLRDMLNGCFRMVKGIATKKTGNSPTQTLSPKP